MGDDLVGSAIPFTSLEFHTYITVFNYPLLCFTSNFSLHFPLHFEFINCGGALLQQSATSAWSQVHCFIYILSKTNLYSPHT